MNNKKELKLFLTFFIIFSYFVHWTGGNENSRLALTRAIVDDGRLEINSYYNQTNDRAYYNGNYYSDKAPGTSLLGVPIYGIWKFVYHFFPEDFRARHIGSEKYITRLFANTPIILYLNPGFFLLTSMILLTSFTSSLFSALTVILIYRIASYFTERYRSLIAIAYGLGSLAFPFGSVFFEHAIGTFFAFLGFYLLFKFKQEKITYSLLAGIVSGFAIVTEYTTLLIAFALFFYILTFKQKNKLIFFALGILLGITPLLVYNYSIFRNPLELTLQHNDPALWSVEEKELRYYGFTSILPDPKILLQITFLPYRGLFFYYPIFLFSLVGLFFFYRKHKVETFLITSLLIIFLWLFSTRRMWWGAYTFGPRYLLPVIPFLFLPMMKIIKNSWVRIFLIFMLVSIFVNVLSLQHWEDMLLDQTTLSIRKEYIQKINSFKSPENPIFNYYLPLFKRYGPRSRIFENLMNKRIDIDIRDEMDYANSAKGMPDFVEIKKPFFSLVPLIFLLSTIWITEIRVLANSIIRNLVYT